jgi:hypothetical protein
MNQATDALRKASGLYAWLIMAAGIFSYDYYAIKTGRAETMSSALWGLLSHPIKSLPAILIWSVVTHHLFVNRNARQSYKVSTSMVRTKIFRYKGE